MCRLQHWTQAPGPLAPQVLQASVIWELVRISVPSLPQNQNLHLNELPRDPHPRQGPPLLHLLCSQPPAGQVAVWSELLRIGWHTWICVHAHSFQRRSQTDGHGRAASHSHLSALLSSSSPASPSPVRCLGARRSRPCPLVLARLSGLTAAKRGAPAGRVWTGDSGLKLLLQQPKLCWGLNS